MVDAFTQGLQHALFAAAYVAGAALPTATTAALLVFGGVPAWRATQVRRTSWRLHRQARRSGRTRT